MKLYPMAPPSSLIHVRGDGTRALAAPRDSQMIKVEPRNHFRAASLSTSMMIEAELPL